MSSYASPALCLSRGEEQAAGFGSDCRLMGVGDPACPIVPCRQLVLQMGAESLSCHHPRIQPDTGGGS